MNPQSPRTPEELERMLSAGMGRAILHLMKQDLSEYRDLILDYSLHNHAYDKQLEETRAEYLYPLIKQSGEEEYYRNAILNAIPNEKDSSNAEQLLDFTVIFARNGDERAREAIYDKLRKNDTDSTLMGENQVIALDGIRGLIFLLDIIGSDKELMSWYEQSFIIEKTEESSSIDEVRVALKQAASENPAVAVALANMSDYSHDWSAEKIIRQRKKRFKEVPVPYAWLSDDTTWEEVKNSPILNRLVFHWPRLASEKEFTKAAQELESNLEAKWLKHYLLLFRKRPFPLDPAPLINLADHQDRVVRIRALSALELINHGSVRDLFNQLYNENRYTDRAIGLLRSNYQNGDHKIILNALENETDPDNIHSICINAMHVYKDNPIPEGLQVLLSVYENTPCSTCRRTCVETIKELYKMPDWMIDECLHDAYSSTRKMAGELKKHK